MSSTTAPNTANPPTTAPKPTNPPSTTSASAKAAHVNMMTDTVIAHLPAEGLRSIMRGLLGTDENFTMTVNFHALAAQYLDATPLAAVSALFGHDGKPTAAFGAMQSRYRCLMGCGRGFGSVELLADVVVQVKGLGDSRLGQVGEVGEEVADVLAVVDGDVVQAVTAMQKELTTSSGMRDMSPAEQGTLDRLTGALLACRQQAQESKREFAFERSLPRLLKFCRISESEEFVPQTPAFSEHVSVPGPGVLETVRLGRAVVPRMFIGLWQFSSPAWGSASRSKVHRDFRKHVDCGFTAYDMADHYGDAEVTFGQFRSSQKDAGDIYCATKTCYFEPTQIMKEVMEANITERLSNISAERVELLQLHWQNYDDHQYIKAATLIKNDPRVTAVGLVNFDTEHMEEILESGVEVVSNQVQFSLIDLRPTFGMLASCKKYNVKLLTYGSLCGGFLAADWLGKPAPSLFGEEMTPSHRKYYEMIRAWGGWDLFQELLSVLSSIGTKYNVSISNVAVRWVLDHECVAAVIVGARMGISEHTEENLKVFGFKLDEEDEAGIGAVLDRGHARDMFDAMGDCGAEYRQ